ncbi:MAG: TlpA family protein disulfide reductase [Bacteroidota bacterium]
MSSLLHVLYTYILIIFFSITLFAGGVGQKLPAFTMEDQNAKEVQSSSLRGKHVLLFLADRAGSKLTPNWTKVLEPKYRNKATFVAVANVASVPFFLKSFIRGKFQENYSYTVLMDWEGFLWDHFSCKNDVTTVVHIDPQGIAKYKISGNGTDKELSQLQSHLDASF